MNGKTQSSQWVLIVMVGCGVIAMILAYMYLQQQSGDAGSEKEVLIFVASHDLPAYKVLEPDEDLKEDLAPVTMVESGLYFTSAYRDFLEGKSINRPIMTGHALMIADVVPTTELHIEEGQVAMSLPVTPDQTFAGLLMPGHRVQILVTKPVEKPEPPLAAAGQTPEAMIANAIAAGAEQPADEFRTTLVSDEKFKVLAVGQQLSPARQQYELLFGEEQGEALAYSSVTLQMTVEQAIKVKSESGDGSFPLTLLLCPPSVGSDEGGGF